MSGSINAQTFETQLALEAHGMTLGIIHGVPNQGFKINLNLNIVKGTIELKLNGIDRLYLDIDTKTFQVAENVPGNFIGHKKNLFSSKHGRSQMCAHGSLLMLIFK
jgi:hypothetical protein